jgi:hypothetical protein
MIDPLNSDVPVETSARGIIRCLRMLAEESDSLHLHRTVAAILEALEICRTETSTVSTEAKELATFVSSLIH